MGLKMKIRAGDKVIVITGKDKGKVGDVIRVMPEECAALVSGVNIAVKKTKPSKALPEGGMVRKEMKIHLSNIAHVDPKTDMPTKVGFKFLEDGKKVRYSKLSGELIDNLK